MLDGAPQGILTALKTAFFRGVVDKNVSERKNP
jgi:hypothetical protein